MNRVKRLKWFVVFMVMAGVSIGILAGCVSKSADGNGIQAKGRYVEQEILLPEDAGVPLGMIYRDGQLVLYTHSENGENYQSHIYEGGQWSKAQEEDWLDDGQKRFRLNAEDVCLGRDGRVYAKAVSDKDEQGIHILTSDDGKTAIDITPPGAGDAVPELADLAVCRDGMIGIGNFDNAMVEFYKEGKIVFSTEGIQAGSEEQTMLEVNDNTAAIMGSDGTSIEFYQTKNFEKINTIELGQNLQDSFLVPGDEGLWYIANTEGIHRLSETGSIAETIMDGADGMMSNDVTWFLRKFVGDEKTQFYAMYSNPEQEWKLMQYKFDSDTAAIQEETLSIYSLSENETVTQAVYEFKSRHPEIHIEYNTSVTGEESPSADHIRILNTELMGGNGADVLILDGLPIEAYIEKGLLTDISDLAVRLEGAGVLANVVENTAQAGGKIYAVPARVNIPLIFGTEEEVNACENIESLTAYAQKHRDKRLFGVTSHDLIGMTLFHTFYDELQKEDGGLNEEKLSALLSAWMQICQNGKLEEYEKKYFEQENSVWPYLDKSFCSSQDVSGDELFADIIEIEGLNASKGVYTNARKAGNLPKSVRGYYVPKTIAGVNASSKQQNLAKEFVESLFSESVQKTDSWNGFPVLNSVLDTYPNYVESEEGKENALRYGGIDWDTGEQYEVVYSYPTKEEAEKLLELFRGLSRPFIQEKMVSDIVLAELENCYAKKQSPEKTARVISRKVDTYLAE